MTSTPVFPSAAASNARATRSLPSAACLPGLPAAAAAAFAPPSAATSLLISNESSASASFPKTLNPAIRSRRLSVCGRLSSPPPKAWRVSKQTVCG